MVSTCLRNCQDDKALSQHFFLWSCAPPHPPSFLHPPSPSPSTDLAPAFQRCVSSSHSPRQDDWEADVGQKAGSRAVAVWLPGPAAPPACRQHSPPRTAWGQEEIPALLRAGISKLSVLQGRGCSGFPLSGPQYCPLNYTALGANGVV